eukprot:TRINITY_DN10066_c0_g1_i1.p1 TRINITY_DN10066_c0_g1~~TRINITY_DN10066_c0_g1_i1.p1  ORF type:complete len:382 (-),score=49.91 TRINITY_DN10066_c0_g1_i1:97-1242(-)
MSSTSAPWVIDSGEGSIKVGIAGEEAPKVVLPSLFARPRASQKSSPAASVQPATRSQCVVGGRARIIDQAFCEVSSPISSGCVQNWEDLEQLWRVAFEEMGQKPTNRPFLLADAPLSPVGCRERAAEIVFETFGAPALHFTPQPVLALYTAGTTTGVVLDCGEGVAHAVPVFNGFYLRSAVRRTPLAGRHVTKHLGRQLRRQGYFVHSASQFETLRTLKEQHCYVTGNRKEEELNLQDSHAAPKVVMLPDGAMLPLGPERFRAPEVLFAPQTVGLDCDSLPSILAGSVGACEVDLRQGLWEQVSLAGGSTLLEGFGARMLLEIRKIVPRDLKIRVLQPPMRAYSAWVGGSILGSLQSFDQMLVSKAQYQEHGGALLTSGSL